MSTLVHLKTLAKNQLARKGYSLRRTDELTSLADTFGSDKGTRFSAHLYTRIYKRFFEKVRNDEITILEIGLLRTDFDKRRASNAAEGITSLKASRAPSLEMWKRYFPKARIFGFDIDDFSDVNIAGCTIARGDMSSRSDLARLVTSIEQPIDIIIEDGSHASHHQQIALGYLFPNVRSGGLYIIEDLHWQDEQMEKIGAPKTRDILRRLQADGRFESPFLSKEEQTYLEQNLDKLWLFDSLTTDIDDASDALAILRKK
jgi:hypothetical protein